MDYELWILDIRKFVFKAKVDFKINEDHCMNSRVDHQAD